MKIINQSAKLLFFITISLTFVFSACKKDKNDDPATKTELITASKWKMTAFTVNPGFPIFDNQGNIIGTSEDMLAQMDACSIDDTFKFNTDMTFVFDEGASKCDSGDPQSTAGTWAFISSETILSITDDGSVQDLTILELKENILKVNYSEIDGSDTYTYTITFTH